MSALTYLILEIIAITTLVLIALRVVADYPKNRNAWLFASVVLGNACYVLTRMTLKAEAAYRLDPTAVRGVPAPRADPAATLQGRHWLLALNAAGLCCQVANGIYWRTGRQDPNRDGVIYALIEGFYGWVVVLTLVGYAYRHFDYHTGYWPI